MPRMTQEEYDADLAEARAEGFTEAQELVAALSAVGLALEGLAGALEGQSKAAQVAVAELRRKAIDSRAAQVAPAPAE